MSVKIFLKQIKIFLRVKKEKNLIKKREKSFPACLKMGVALPYLFR
jgi:mannitol/fructose-specific phosphotransferase system IIA component (Ntr-type)